MDLIEHVSTRNIRYANQTFQNDFADSAILFSLIMIFISIFPTFGMSIALCLSVYLISINITQYCYSKNTYNTVTSRLYKYEQILSSIVNTSISFAHFCLV